MKIEIIFNIKEVEGEEIKPYPIPIGIPVSVHRLTGEDPLGTVVYRGQLQTNTH